MKPKKTGSMKVRLLSGFVALLLFNSGVCAQSNIGTFQFSGTIDRAVGDLSAFPGAFGVGSTFRGSVIFDRGMIDLEPRTDLAFFELSTPPGELTVSVTDLLGNSYDFRASEPFMYIYYHWGSDFPNSVRVGSSTLTAYGQHFTFALHMLDEDSNIVSSDQLNDFSPTADWSQVRFELNSFTGTPYLQGLATVVPEPGTLEMLILGLVVAWIMTRRKPANKRIA